MGIPTEEEHHQMLQNDYRPADLEQWKAARQRFSAEITQEWETSRGVGWTGVLTDSDKTVIATVENTGTGGPNNWDVEDQKRFDEYSAVGAVLYPDDGSEWQLGALFQMLEGGDENGNMNFSG